MHAMRLFNCRLGRYWGKKGEKEPGKHADGTSQSQSYRDLTRQHGVQTRRLPQLVNTRERIMSVNCYWTTGCYLIANIHRTHTNLSTHSQPYESV